LVVAPEYRPNWGRRTSEARARRRSTPTVVVNGPASHDGLATPREILATSERSVAAKWNAVWLALTPDVDAGC
jgi:hypothetical protein